MPESPAVAAARRYAEQNNPKRSDWYAKIAREVERDYTEAIVRLHYRGRIYDIPANFFSFNGRSRFKKFALPGPERYEIRETGDFLSGLHFFWPKFNGFTLDNWFDQFDRRMINYTGFQLELPGSTNRTTEEVFGLRMSMQRIEEKPSVELHGLKGYRFSHRGDYAWVGTRAGGKMFMMDAFDPRDKTAAGLPPNPHCDARMYDRGTREDVSYFYSLDLFEHWLEIDTRTQAMFRTWRVS